MVPCRQVVSCCRSWPLFCRGPCSPQPFLLPKWNFLHWVPAEWNLFFKLFLQFVEIILISVPALCNTCSPILHLRKPFSYPGDSWNSSDIKGTRNSLRTDRFSPLLIISYSGSKLYWTEGDSRWTRVRGVQHVPFLHDLCPSPSGVTLSSSVFPTAYQTGTGSIHLHHSQSVPLLILIQ